VSRREPGEPGVAVALKYSGAGAPRVTAKGHGEVADRIRELGLENAVPTHQDPELARVLARVDLGEEIPEALYLAVAEVIAFAYRLRDMLDPSMNRPVNSGAGAPRLPAPSQPPPVSPRRSSNGSISGGRPRNDS